jgi:hypothetical protein
MARRGGMEDRTAYQPAHLAPRRISRFVMARLLTFPPTVVFDIGDPIWKPSRLADHVGADRSVGPEARPAAESA